MDATAASSQTIRPRILIVEDDAGIRRSMQLLLQGQGLDVRAYATGMPLLVDTASKDAACFIADYRLDGEDGIAVLKALRDRGWNGPAILVTAFSSKALVRQAIEAGFTSVFEKPLREHALVDTVLRLVHQPDGAP